MKKFLITLILGPFGIHKFMEGKVGLGIIYLLTGGICGIGWIVDVVKAALALGSTNSAPSQAPTSNSTSYIFNVVGEKYRKKEICTILEENIAYKKINKNYTSKVYKYNVGEKQAELVPEPSNPHDPNAIMVKIDGVLVGYVPADECKDVKNILQFKEIESINAEVYGGDYKFVYEDEIVKENRDFSISVRIDFK